MELTGWDMLIPPSVAQEASSHILQLGKKTANVVLDTVGLQASHSSELLVRPLGPYGPSTGTCDVAIVPRGALYVKVTGWPDGVGTP